jgi:EAL domain-containing protein (putative c-di-GMP-specific phosphodiesterase class I)
MLVGCLPPGRVLSRFKVSPPSFVIGRRTGVDLQLASPCVSGRHAEILCVGEHLFVRDLGSTNGTFVNRRRVTQPTPIAAGDHIEIADVEFRLELESAETQLDETVRVQKKTSPVLDALDSDWILSQFDTLVGTRAITPYYQPIVNLREGKTIGYEALARTQLCGLETPALLFQTAQLVNQEASLSILCRQRAVEDSIALPEEALLFVNTHPAESLDVDVLPSLVRLRQSFPWVQLVVEIHEGAAATCYGIQDFADRLRSNGIKLAYDDFGAGQSRLLELATAPADFLKFDRGLIRNLSRNQGKQRQLVKMLVQVALDSGTVPLAEGVETAEEAEACLELGFQLAQGYFFGHPAPPEQLVNSACEVASRPKLSNKLAPLTSKGFVVPN